MVFFQAYLLSRYLSKIRHRANHLLDFFFRVCKTIIISAAPLRNSHFLSIAFLAPYYNVSLETFQKDNYSITLASCALLKSTYTLSSSILYQGLLGAG